MTKEEIKYIKDLKKTAKKYSGFNSLAKKDLKALTEYLNNGTVSIELKNILIENILDIENRFKYNQESINQRNVMKSILKKL